MIAAGFYDVPQRMPYREVYQGRNGALIRIYGAEMHRVARKALHELVRTEVGNMLDRATPDGDYIDKFVSTHALDMGRKKSRRSAAMIRNIQADSDTEHRSLPTLLNQYCNIVEEGQLNLMKPGRDVSQVVHIAPWYAPMSRDQFVASFAAQHSLLQYQAGRQHLHLKISIVRLVGADDNTYKEEIKKALRIQKENYLCRIINRYINLRVQQRAGLFVPPLKDPEGARFNHLSQRAYWNASLLQMGMDEAQNIILLVKQHLTQLVAKMR